MDKKKEYYKLYYAKNKEKIQQYYKEHYTKNFDKNKQQRHEYYINNKETIINNNLNTQSISIKAKSNILKALK